MIKNLKIVFTSAIVVLIAVNSYQLFRKLSPERPVLFAGIQFAGLYEFLKSETRMGYLTDLNIDDDQNLAEFQQAQYMLSPIILELNHTQTPFVIVRCSTDQKAIELLQIHQLQPLKRNQFGVILARNPNIPLESGIQKP